MQTQIYALKIPKNIVNKSLHHIYLSISIHTMEDYRDLETGLYVLKIQYYSQLIFKAYTKIAYECVNHFYTVYLYTEMQQFDGII